MVGELKINKKDAWITWGVRMGDGFFDALGAASDMKDVVTSDSKLEHGVRVITKDAKVNSREVTLVFNLEGDTHEEFKERKASFFSELYNGDVDISIPSDSDEVYHLVYKKNVSYAANTDRTFCKISVKFLEPNPTERNE